MEAIIIDSTHQVLQGLRRATEREGLRGVPHAEGELGKGQQLPLQEASGTRAWLRVWAQ